MQANILPLHTASTHGVKFFSNESIHVAHQIKRNEAQNTMQANILPLLHALNARVGSKHFCLK